METNKEKKEDPLLIITYLLITTIFLIFSYFSTNYYISIFFLILSAISCYRLVNLLSVCETSHKEVEKTKGEKNAR